MIAALLGNGPSRIAFDKTLKHYDLIVGCNMPWTQEVDFTVINDLRVLNTWKEQNQPYKVWLNNKLEKEVKSKKIIGYTAVDFPFDSVAHVAFRVIVRQYGYKEIDIYGVDAMTTKSDGSYSRNFWKDEWKTERQDGWIQKWKELLDYYPDVKVEFKI